MRVYQEQYIENVKKIEELSREIRTMDIDFSQWIVLQKQNQRIISELKAENNRLLNENLFPALDELYSASQDTLSELEQFADELMDWRTNLDCGIYVTIHEALLKIARIRHDRNSLIKELYKTGIGLYYRNRMIAGIDDQYTSSFYFQNEMLFTEAASFLRYFEEIEDEDTKGYIIRAAANIALCTKDHKRKIAASAKTLRLCRDAYIRALAPTLPWDAFIRKTHQQMSANRSELSKGDLTKEELAEVLDSCYEVFKPEENAENPSVRWLWPYYDMEYCCGYVDLTMTLDRLEQLIDTTPEKQFDMNGLYGSVQLPAYYGRLLEMNPQSLNEQKRTSFLDKAYRKALSSLLACPKEKMDDFYFYLVEQMLTNYVEIPGLISYREFTESLIMRLDYAFYIRARKSGVMIQACCEKIITDDPLFFDDIPFLAEIKDVGEKKKTLFHFAEECGLFYNFGMIKQNISRTANTRSLFEDEFAIFRLHTVSGADDLRKRTSTAEYADVAEGHHSWYNGAGGYPSGYIRIHSPYRQMTDLVSVISFMTEREDEDIRTVIDDILKREQTQFSPLITKYLTDPELITRLDGLLHGDDNAFYLEIYHPV